MRLLLLSNSTNAGEEFLKYPLKQINEFLGQKSLNIIFIPFAAVTISFDDYEHIVKERFNDIGHNLTSIHKLSSMTDAVKNADAIVIGGGNTFQLLKLLQTNNLLIPIKEKILNGAPYIGWSAGANVACPTICTTNDMPIVEPQSLKSINLIPFQINPHYIDFVPSGHGGETRNQRITEYLIANQDKTVVGLWEGTMLRQTNNKLELIGEKKGRIFTYNNAYYDVGEQDDINFLISKS